MGDQNDILVLITNTYPYGVVAESFVGPELPHLATEFNKVIIVPLERAADSETTQRPLLPNVSVDDSFLNRYANKKELIVSIISSVLSPMMYRELLGRPDAIGVKGIRRLIDHLSMAFRVRKWAAGMIRENKIDTDRTVFYTYWLGASTHGLVLEKHNNRRMKIVSRAHRGDLYEEEHVPSYLPFRKSILSQIEKLFAISEDGRKYISERYPDYANKYEISRLGVNDSGHMNPGSSDGIFRIASCSYIIPVKRLNLMISGLHELGNAYPDRHFVWTHIGFGPLEKEIKSMASAMLPENVHYRFTGKLEAGGVLRFYDENEVDVFINVSKSEGIPVSIMEAQSCGIPVIATAVGGTPEIVNADVGTLLSPNPSPHEVSDALIRFINEPRLAKKKRESARTNWEVKYDADINFKRFAQYLARM